MKNEWQALKVQKEKELPSVQAERDEYLEKHVDKFEKQVLEKARKQKAGTSCVYGYRRSFLWYVAKEFLIEDDLFTEDNFSVESRLTKRLKSYGIDARQEFLGVRVTLTWEDKYANIQ